MNDKTLELLQTKEFYIGVLHSASESNEPIEETALFLSAQAKKMVDYCCSISRIISTEQSEVAYSAIDMAAAYKQGAKDIAKLSLESFAKFLAEYGR